MQADCSSHMMKDDFNALTGERLSSTWSGKSVLNMENLTG